MLRWSSKALFYMGALLSCLMMSVTTGCASGGFKITRQYARFVNSQMIILRIILYIFTAIVFAVTLLIDMVIFNTIDFWEGKVSQGDYEFKDGGKTYHAHHEILPSKLKRSTIKISDENGKHLQEVVLRETENNEVDLIVDGIVRAHVRDIKSVPVVSLFNEKGTYIGENLINLELPLAAR